MLYKELLGASGYDMSTFKPLFLERLELISKKQFDRNLLRYVVIEDLEEVLDIETDARKLKRLDSYILEAYYPSFNKHELMGVAKEAARYMDSMTLVSDRDADGLEDLAAHDVYLLVNDFFDKSPHSLFYQLSILSFLIEKYDEKGFEDRLNFYAALYLFVMLGLGIATYKNFSSSQLFKLSSLHKRSFYVDVVWKALHDKDNVFVGSVNDDLDNISSYVLFNMKPIPYDEALFEKYDLTDVISDVYKHLGDKAIFVKAFEGFVDSLSLVELFAVRHNYYEFVGFSIDDAMQFFLTEDEMDILAKVPEDNLRLFGFIRDEEVNSLTFDQIVDNFCEFYGYERPEPEVLDTIEEVVEVKPSASELKMLGALHGKKSNREAKFKSKAKQFSKK